MTFSGSAAWSDAMRRIRERFGVALGMAALFFAVQMALLGLLIGGLIGGIGEMATLVDPTVAGLAAFGTFGIILIAYALFAALMLIGQTAIVALLDDPPRPGFSGAFKAALKGTPTMIGVTILLMIGYFVFSLGLVLLFGLIGAMVMDQGPGGMLLAFPLMIGFFVAILYIATRLSIISPVAVLEGVRNPFSVIGRSWSLTSQAHWRLLGFYLLLALAAVVIGFLISLVFGGVMGVTGMSQNAQIFGGVGLGFMGFSLFFNLLAMLLFAGLATAVYRQLAGTSPDETADVFS